MSAIYKREVEGYPDEFLDILINIRQKFISECRNASWIEKINIGNTKQELFEEAQREYETKYRKPLKKITKIVEFYNSKPNTKQIIKTNLLKKEREKVAKFKYKKPR
ncbi:MAG: hypothetical protein V1824_02090 [archaeon]